MNSIVLYPSVSSESAKMLAGFLGCDSLNPFKQDRRDFRDYDCVINYGCNRNIKAPRIINKASAVARCIDKFSTFSILEKWGIPIPRFAVEKVKAADWECVVVRAERDGHANAGLDYVYPRGRLDKIPSAELYTEYFHHKKEFRVVVLNAITIACYEKVREGDEWMFYERTYQYLDPIRDACSIAAQVLGIDYVGFDVLVDTNNEFVILEANSAPIITEDVMKHFKRYLKKIEKGLA